MAPASQVPRGSCEAARAENLPEHPARALKRGEVPAPAPQLGATGSAPSAPCVPLRQGCRPRLRWEAVTTHGLAPHPSLLSKLGSLTPSDGAEGRSPRPVSLCSQRASAG